MGSVLTWHMYCPLSSLLTPLRFRVHVLKSLWVTERRALLVMTCSYRENTSRLSALFRDWPMTALDSAAFLVEYVIRHRGAPHLRTAAVDLAWYQYLLIDMGYREFYIFTFISFALLTHGQSANILGVFEFNGKSHFLMFERLMKSLAERGHEVHVLSHFPQKKPLPNYFDIDVSGSVPNVLDSFTIETVRKRDTIGALNFIWTVTRARCEAIKKHPNAQKLLNANQKYDLLIMESFGSECFIGLADKLKTPLVTIVTSVGMPWDIQKFLDESEHGVVYFSLGSIVQVQTFSLEKLKALMDEFGTLPERVLMKYTGDTLPGQPSNVMTGKWLPQQDILRFAVRLLYDDITKESLLSAIRTLLDDPRYAANAKKTSFQFRDRPHTALETAVYWVEYGLTLYAGVPIVGIPLFADQELNIKRCVLQGFAVRLLYDDITKESLLSAIRTLLDNPRYSANAKKTSFQFRDRPHTALETAVYWVEYVIRHRGAPHLRSAGADLTNIPVLAVGRYISSSAWCSVILVPHIYRHQDCVEFIALSLDLLSNEMMTKAFLILSIIALLHDGQTAKILGVFEFNGKSHFQMYEKMMKGLSERGHEVHVLNHFPQKKPFSNYFDIDVSGSVPNVLDNFTIDLVRTWDTKTMLSFIWDFTRTQCEVVLKHPNAQKLLKSTEKYDLIIMESFGSECTIALAHKFKVPLVAMVSSVALPWTHHRIGNPDHPAYIPSYFISYGSQMSFIERFWNTLYYITINTANYYFNEIPTNELSKRIYGNDIPPIEEIAKNTSLILVNSHFSISGPRPVVPGFVEVGGLHIEEPKALPKRGGLWLSEGPSESRWRKAAALQPSGTIGVMEFPGRNGNRIVEFSLASLDIQKFMDESEHGVVYFSLGSLIQVQTFAPEKLKALMDAFAALPERVLMKYTGDTLPGQPSNVMTGKWLPQLDILSQGHPKTRLFISHGGLMGTLEAVYAGVPIVGIPLFADQELNIKRCVLQGFAVRLLYDDITKESLLSAIRTLLDNPRYSANAKKTSFQFRDRPHTALETAVYWVEYVIRHRGAPHLRSAGADLPTYQYLLLDVISVLVLGVVSFLYLTYIVIRTVLRYSFPFQIPLYHFNGGLWKKEEELEDERMDVFLVTRRLEKSTSRKHDYSRKGLRSTENYCEIDCSITINKLPTSGLDHSSNDK
uniref:UDP-glycosyltransferase n=1 Tax=Timema tahoe TaxID=61484 RepID=A0A7R9IB55_9NEOP|nr:unnamed protein product [Timema tahoe]